MTTGDQHAANAWEHIVETPSHSYLAPAVLGWVRSHRPDSLLDLGCGDGRLTAILAREGVRTTGADFSPAGVDRARREHPEADFFIHAMGDPLPPSQCGAYSAVIAVEVIEHLLLPRDLFRRAAEALVPGGPLLLTTPYHGYAKNLALSLVNKWDDHHMAMSDYGHVKFFSRRTLVSMGVEQGFQLVELQRVGRIPVLAASMVATFRSPS